MGSLRERGYVTHVHRRLRAADHGVPQTRVRLFIVAFADVGRGSDSAYGAAARAFAFPSPSAAPPRTFGNIRQHDDREPGSEPFRITATNVRKRLAHLHVVGQDRRLRVVRDDRPLPTITRGCTNVVVHVHGDHHRLLTRRERMRAQGFPDDYYHTDGSRPTLGNVGNAVPPPLVAAVMGKIAAVLALR
jgi:site-specific DNA-cytosine methylase